MEEGAAPIAPDFARQQVFETGKPDSVEAGTHVEFTLGTDMVAPAAPITGEKLDLTSLGSPENTSVTATAVASGGGTTDLGSDRSPGHGSGRVRRPADLGEGARVVLEAQPSGSTVTIPVTSSAEPVEPTTTATATPDRLKVGGGTSDIEVSVSSGDAPTPTGEVVVSTVPTSLVGRR